MYKTVLYIFCTTVVVATVALGQAPQYKLGRPAAPKEIRELDISVAPDGSGLPKGGGTVAQGQQIYKSLCANCHGDQGQGTAQYPAVAGGQGTLKSKDPLRTVGSFWPYATTVWEFIHRTMPYQKPGSLTVDETYSVTAFVLYMSAIVDEKANLNERNLAQVKMPNRDGFIRDPRPDVPSSKHNK
jgi:cytochrome c